jgi:hypothetical protein
MKQFEKHLTLHLYRKDEVLGALRWAIVNHNISESIYWGLELFDSDMEQDALQMLEYIWLTEIGMSSTEFLTSILNTYTTGELDRETWIDMLHTLSRVSQRDSTLLYLLIRGMTTLETWKPVFSHSLTYTTIHDAVRDTLQRGKLLEAWLLARAMTPEDQWSLVKKLADNCGRQEFIIRLNSSTLSDTEKRATAFTCVSLNEVAWLKSIQPLIKRQLPSEVESSIEEWDAEESLRKRRVYTIKPEALLYLTKRSNQSQQISSESDIQDELIINLLESSYWRSILNEYMNGTIWKSDAYKEMFFDTYFRCDIPDEWSSQDREKSHGRGLGRTDSVGLQRFFDTLFLRSKITETRYYIKPEEYMETLDWDTSYKILNSKCLENLESQLPLKPIMKSFEII